MHEQKKLNLRGTGEVFGFTMRQQLKNRANQITFIILLLISAAAVPVSTLLFGGDSDESLQLLVNVETAGEYLSQDTVGFDTRYGVQYVYSMVVMIICVFSTTYIVRALVEEKASRLVETLMLSVSAMALLIGKILAVMVFMFGQFLAIVVVFLLSSMVTIQVLQGNFVLELIDSFGVSTEALQIDVGTAVVVLFSLLLAYLLFSEIAGLAGAGCANIDEIEGANMVSTTAILGGFLVACFSVAFSSGPVSTFLAICPIISSFTLPAYYVLGSVGWGTVLLSWAMTCGVIILLIWLAARVYDRLMMYRGNRLSMGKILRMVRQDEQKEGGKQA